MLASVLRTIYSGEGPTKQGDGLFKAELPHPSGGDGSRHRPSRGAVLLAVPGSKIRPVRRRRWLDLGRKKHMCVRLPAATEGEPVHENRPRQRRGAASRGRQTCRLDGERGRTAATPAAKPRFFFFFFAAKAFARIELNTALPLWTFSPPTDCSMECAKED